MRDYAAVPQGTKLVTAGYGNNASYTHTETETETEFLQSFQSDDPIFGNVTRGDQIPYVPRHELNVSVGIEHPRFGINGTMTHVAKTRELASSGSIDETLHADAQTIFDATGYVRICDDVQLYVNGRNLADARYIVSRRLAETLRRAPQPATDGAGWAQGHVLTAPPATYTDV